MARDVPSGWDVRPYTHLLALYVCYRMDHPAALSATPAIISFHRRPIDRIVLRLVSTTTVRNVTHASRHAVPPRRWLRRPRTSAAIIGYTYNNFVINLAL